MRELFVYYRVREADAARALEAVRAMQLELRSRHPTLVACLLKRPHGAAEVQTWMETYSGVDDDVALRAAVQAAALGWAHLVDGPRHVEEFEPFADGEGGDGAQRPV